MVEGRRRQGHRFAYPPQLLLLDGGKGQLGVGVRVLDELGLTGRSRSPRSPSSSRRSSSPAGPSRSASPVTREAIYLLQQIRDEAHRFAISYHRELRASG